jgi:hypothetical protein
MFWIRYIKKEDIPAFLKRQFIVQGVSALLLALLIGFAQLSLVPSVRSLYDDLGKNIPLIMKLSYYFSPLIIIAFLVLAVYYFKSKVDPTVLDSIDKRYKSLEMVNIKELIDYKKQWGMVGAIFLGIIYASVITYLPLFYM